jgi:hypothetical protein
MQSENQVDRHHVVSTGDESKMEKRFPTNNKKAPAFSIRHRVDLELDLDFALALGDHILSNQCSNPAIVALGHQLQNLEPYEKDDQSR